jgi:ribonuclease J
MAHSIPEPNALVIRTPAGVVLHSGDWKLDPDPIVGPPTDEETLRRTGEEGVLALICDSTNALTPGHSGSEADLLPSLTTLFGRYKNRIAIASFASNVARLETIAKAAHANDRQVALVGRSLWRIDAAARQTGYLKDIPPFLTEHDLGYVPRDKIVMICTGSQGEPRSALSRLSADDHPQARLEAGDVAIFSARGIPGNERAIIRVQNQLVQLGVEIVTSHDAFVHVSGHPAQDELTAMYQWVRPKIAIPVHGEAQHLTEHARLARAAQVGQALIPENGALIRLHPGPAEIVDHVESGLWALDGKSIVPLDNGAFRDRNRMINNGAAVATVVLDRKGRLIAEPKVSLLGLPTGVNGSNLVDDVVAAVRNAIDMMPLQALKNDEEVRQTVRIAVRRQVNASQGKKPLTDVQLVRV